MRCVACREATADEAERGSRHGGIFMLSQEVCVSVSDAWSTRPLKDEKRRAPAYLHFQNICPAFVCG